MGSTPIPPGREPTNREAQAREPERFDPMAFVEEHVWTFAKTMPQIPHEYLVRGKNGCADEDWDAFAAYIKEHGYKARWTAPSGRHMYNVYRELGEWKFWVIFPVINRERIENSTTLRLDSETDAGSSQHLPQSLPALHEPEEFIASVPWRAVKMVEVGDTGKTPDPHEYVIKDWREVDTSMFDAFVRLIKAEGYRATYRAPYRPDYVMTNHYLEINGWCYWFIYPNMLNRERAEHRKHKPIPD